ncbi:MAG: RES domain-containing protein [Phenylobacterium sp.]|jgi:RES domain-containing protein
MIAIYRLVKKKWDSMAFDGEGARLYGGRWNSKGKECVYTAGSESLAMLEVLVHLESQKLLDHYSMIEVPLAKKHILRLSIEDLPDCWREEPASPDTALIGNEWLDSKVSLALAVPSVVVPREWIYLLNPNHPDFLKVVNQARRLEFEADKRLGDH